MNELEDTLIEMNNQIMKIEDTSKDEWSRLEAKKIFLLGILKQVDTELGLLEVEYDHAGLSLDAEQETLELFEDSRNAYNDIMGHLFKH